MSEPLRILIVDDSRVSRMMSSAMVKALRKGLEIIEAANGDAALLAQQETPCHVGILDMNMPGMTSLELAENLAEIRPGLPLALLTAHVQGSIRNRAEQQGVHFFRKPISEGLIGQILTKLAPKG